ncbi:IPT/TIG domain-containing protein [Sphingobacterium sp. HJSM2_6]|uniref:IPT/TIG domain-containing protein n=1 Tax=Sphingobacterium sp. HJSM2_6 TaxID=3366264 RepID=UPI003BBD4A66
MMKTINFKIYILGIVFLATLSSCEEQVFQQVVSDYVHDKNAPIILNRFAPMEASESAEITLFGDNFSSNASEVKVQINGTDVPVLGASQRRIIVKIPQGLGSGKWTVTVGDHTVESTDEFIYAVKRTVSTLASSSPAATFNFLVNAGMDIDSKGNLYFTDNFNNCIRKVSPDGTVTTFAGVPGVEGNVDGPGAKALFNHPTDVAVDAEDNVYVADSWNWAIRKIDPQGTVSTVRGWIVPFPQGITVDPETGVIYGVSALPAVSNNQIFALEQNGAMTLHTLSVPIASGGISMDNDRNLIIADNHKSVIYRVNTSTKAVETLAGLENEHGWVDGIGQAARFEYPWGVAVDKDNNIYVAGCGHRFEGPTIASTASNIRMIEAGTNKVSTIAGGPMGYKDGIAGEARFNVPTGIAVDDQGAVYVLDRDNLKIRKIISE